MSCWAALGLYFLTWHNPDLVQWRLLFPGGRVEAHWGRELPAPTPTDLEAVWRWSMRQPPTRIRAEDLARFSPAAPSRDFRSFRRHPAAKTNSPPALLMAAPVAMWAEVPEPLLPTWTWPADAPELSLPTSFDTPWRARLLAGDHGSFWTDLTDSQERATLAALPADNREIEVVGRDGSPTTNLKVDVFRSSGFRQGRHLARLATETGRISAAALPDQEEAALWVRSPSAVPVAVRGYPSTWPARLVLDAGLAVYGRIVDAEGNGLSGIELRLERELQGLKGYAMQRGVSAAQGVFRFEHLEPGYFLLRTAKPEQGSLRLEVPLEAADLDVGELVLGRAVGLVVRVLSSSGLPLEGAEIELMDGRIFSSDAEGLAKVSDLDPQDKIELEVRAPFHIPHQNLRIEAPWPDVLEVRLDPGFYLRGSFVGEGGESLAPGQVRGSVGIVSQLQNLQPSGEFELLLPLERLVQLALASRQGPSLELVLEPGREGEVRELGELRPPAGFTLLGRVVEAADQRPVAGARIWLPRPTTDHEMLALMQNDVIEVFSHEDGTFSMAGLPRLGGRLRIESATLARRELELTPPPAESASVDLGDIELYAGARVEVEVPGASTNAIARLDLRGEGLPADQLVATILGEKAIFLRVPAGRALLQVLERGALRCEKELDIPAREELRTSCRAKAIEVTGRVLLGGRPAPGGQLVFQTKPNGVPQIIERRTTPGGLDRSHVIGQTRPAVEVVVRSEGDFKTSDLTPGEWIVYYAFEGHSLSETRAVTLPDVDTTDLTLEFPSKALYGRVEDLAHRPVAAALVREERQGLSGFSNADGQFTLFGAQAGHAVLSAEWRGTRSPRVEVEVPESGDAEPVLLVLGAEDAASQISVSVTREGEAAGGALVFVETPEGHRELLTADAAGVAVFELPRPWPSAWRAGAYAGGCLALGEWRAWKEADSRIYELEPAGCGSLTLSAKERQVPKITNAQGWDLTLWLGRLGLYPLVLPQQPTSIAGIPAGHYRLQSPKGLLDIELGQQENVQLELP